MVETDEDYQQHDYLIKIKGKLVKSIMDYCRTNDINFTDLFRSAVSDYLKNVDVYDYIQMHTTQDNRELSHVLVENLLRILNGE